MSIELIVKTTKVVEVNKATPSQYGYFKVEVDADGDLIIGDGDMGDVHIVHKSEVNAFVAALSEMTR
jgi:hypothetical protein